MGEGASGYQVARWFARGAILHNYYMYCGGNNYGRTAGAGVQTRYADSAPLYSDGLRNEPAFTHLSNLHSVLHRISEKPPVLLKGVTPCIIKELPRVLGTPPVLDRRKEESVHSRAAQVSPPRSGRRANLISGA